MIVQNGIYSSEEIEFQDIPDGNLTDVDQMTLDVEGLIAGRVYVFQITASNDIGSAAVRCPPVIHTVGKPSTKNLKHEAGNKGIESCQGFFNLSQSIADPSCRAVNLF